MDTSPKWTWLIGGLTWYRILAAPLLLALIFADQFELFKWLLVVSFMTDAIDGPLSRHYKIASDKGARLDSLGDDLTVAVALVGLWRWEKHFVLDNLHWVAILFGLLVFEVLLALARYGKMTSFHTYLSKTAAVLQGIYLCWYFLMGEPPRLLFYLCMLVTSIALIEEILLVVFLKNYECDVKGIYWKWLHNK